jgi:para-aminobenzoate synthetase component 1
VPGPVCGAIGYIDADVQQAQLAVGIRTFSTSEKRSLLNFGTGAGIPYSSNPATDCEEAELKARLLIRLASGP